jgi:alkanesulfonate monooxygenase SsuD/methylene tetrahydromethanopterin reductase-like flavin-dependent oxidoreductase (luciferase family)
MNGHGEATLDFGTFMEFHARPGRSQAEDFAEGWRQVDLAEQAGLDAIWMAESHFQPERAVMTALMAVGSAIAARTKRVKIGTAVQVLPLTDPMRMAEETATLDQISEGRFEFGIGRSGSPAAYDGYGIDYSTSTERTFEDLEIIKGLWTNEHFTYKGKFHSYDKVCLVPKPVQSPHPPLRIAANSAASFPVVGKLDLPLFIGVRQHNTALVEGYVDSYQAARKEAGFDGPPDVSIRIPVYISESREEAQSVPEKSFMKQFARLGGQIAVTAGREDVAHDSERASRTSELASLAWDVVSRDKVVVGTPEMVIDRIHELKERLKLTSLVAEFNAGEEIPESDIERSMRLLCDKVMPAFK